MVTVVCETVDFQRSMDAGGTLTSLTGVRRVLGTRHAKDRYMGGDYKHSFIFLYFWVSIREKTFDMLDLCLESKERGNHTR